MIELRLRNSLRDEDVAKLESFMLDPEHITLLARRSCRILKPSGKPLCVYLRGALSQETLDAAYPTLHEMRGMMTNNRGPASGTPRAKGSTPGGNTYAKDVASAIAGSMESTGRFKYCRLTAYTKNHLEQWREVYPLLHEVASLFEENVPDRYAAQAKWGAQSPEWLIPGTPFTTVTVNNTYPTGAHYDKGDLDEGFSCLTVLRRGDWSGGELVFPKYGVGVDLKEGDLILMDAHEMHGNLRMRAEDPETGEEFEPTQKNELGCERISVVCYYRTEIASCGTQQEELARANAFSETRMEGRLSED